MDHGSVTGTMNNRLDGSERRRHRRLNLSIPIRLKGSEEPVAGKTSDVSTGGMYLVMDETISPQLGQELIFELLVPPGQGHWPTVSRVSGLAKVVRVSPVDTQQLGVGLQFTTRLAMQFA